MNQKDFEQIYLEYYKPVYAFLLARCGDESLAADLTQETFFKALKSIGQFRGDSSLNVWLCGIAKNALVSHWRRHRREMPLEDAVLPEEPAVSSPATEVETAEQKLDIHRALHTLPEPYREVFWLRVYGELSFADIAALFEKTETWARVTFYRARTKLKEALT
nr:RNA polymerase sigma factor [uncultured Gemmiger sp.]